LKTDNNGVYGIVVFALDNNFIYGLITPGYKFLVCAQRLWLNSISLPSWASTCRPSSSSLDATRHFLGRVSPVSMFPTCQTLYGTIHLVGYTTSSFSTRWGLSYAVASLSAMQHSTPSYKTRRKMMEERQQDCRPMPPRHRLSNRATSHIYGSIEVDHGL
jgi:hypothetical protein